LFGNPFRHELFDSSARPPGLLSPSEIEANQIPLWLSRNEGAARNLAQRIYEQRAFDDMPALADALAAAGCDDFWILDHCRTWVFHVRGCWVLDLLLGRDQSWPKP
jgi:hypothetical protein